MKINYLHVAAIMTLALPALSWTEAETNLVGRQMADMAIAHIDFGGCSSQDYDDQEADEEDDLLFEVVSLSDFFAMRTNDVAVALGWTAEDRRLAFLKYLDSISCANGSEVSTEEVARGCGALSFCSLMRAAETVPFAMSILANANAPHGFAREANKIFRQHAQASEWMNSQVASVLNNAECLPEDGLRYDVFASYLDKLNHAFDSGETNVVRSGAAMLLHAGAELEPCRLDALLGRAYPEYATSSNRLDFACRMLAAGDGNQYVTNYFTSITNALLNAEQPLPVVEGL